MGWLQLSYTLHLTVDTDSLKTIKKAGQKIVLAKQVDATAPDVAWLVFDPFQGNTIEWEEQFGIYASTLPELKDGATISKMSSLDPALDGESYVFSRSGCYAIKYFLGVDPRCYKAEYLNNSYH
jgi:hypothetical protein